MRLLVPESLEPNRLDVARLLLALGVILSHGWALLRGTDATEPVFTLLHGWTTLGGICLSGFFALSDFLVLRSRERSSSTLDFLLRRVRRIYPGFLVACLVTFVVVYWIGPHAEVVHGVQPFRYFRDSLFLVRPRIPGAFAANPFPGEPNGPLYTVQIEFALYLLLATMAKFGERVDRAFWPTLAVLGLAFWTVVPNGFHAPGHYGWLLDALEASIVPFSIGASLWVLRERIPTSPLLQAIAAASLALVFFVLTGPLVRPSLWLLGSYLLFASALSPRWKDEGIARYGDFSYGTYLYGWLVQQTLVTYFVASLNPATLFLFAAPISLALGAASYFIVERPFLLRMRHIRRKIAL